MTLANNWGYVPNDHFKSAAQVIHSLIEVVAKGGNLLLGIGPKPDGTLSDTALERMREIGKWMHSNGEAIYNTRATRYYHDGAVYFTQNSTTGIRYALACLRQDESLPSYIVWHRNTPIKGSSIKLLQTGEKVKWVQEGNQTTIEMPVSVKKAGRKFPALAFAFTPTSE